VIDGRLDDPVWQTAPVRYLALPGNLAPLYPAEVRLTWDDQAIYVGFDIADPDLRATITQRDGWLWEDGDCAEFFLAARGQEDRRIEIEINAAGAMLDILHEKGKPFPDAVAWTAAGAEWGVRLRGTLNDERQDEGWSAELRLPWSAVSVLGVGPQAGPAEFRTLFMVINRVRLGPDRVGREQFVWPVLPQVTTTLPEQYATLAFVPADRSALPFEGFCRIDRGRTWSADALFPDYRGPAAWWECVSTDPRTGLRWQTERLPAPLPDPVRLMFVGQTIQREGEPGGSDRAEFELLVNGRPAVAFTPFRREDTEWTAGDVRLEFRHRSGRAWPNGPFRLTVPAAWLRPGEPATLELRPTGRGPRTSFLLKGWKDAALYEHYWGK